MSYSPCKPRGGSIKLLHKIVLSLHLIMHLTTISTPMLGWWYRRFLTEKKRKASRQYVHPCWDDNTGGFWLRKRGKRRMRSNFRYAIILWLVFVVFGWESFVIVGWADIVSLIHAALDFTPLPTLLPFLSCIFGGVMWRVSLSTTGKVAYFLRGIVTWLRVWGLTLLRPGRPYHHVISPM